MRASVLTIGKGRWQARGAARACHLPLPIVSDVVAMRDALTLDDGTKNML
jgi:hypothetical protein